MKSDGLTASIHCNQSEETWYLACKGNKWEGKFDNCSSGKNILLYSNVVVTFLHIMSIQTSCQVILIILMRFRFSDIIQQ